VLLSRSLESTLTELGGSVDPLKLNLLKSSSGSVNLEGLSEGNNSLLDTGDGTLEDDKVVLDLTVSDETTHGGDGLLGAVELSGTVRLVVTTADSVDLVVDGSSVVVTVLTGTGNSPLNVGRMPSTDTGDLSQTTMSLSGKSGGTPSVGNTLVTVTLGDGNDIDVLVLLENRGDIDGLLKVLLSESNLVINGTTVDLDLSKVGLLLAKGSLADLGVGKNTDDSGVLSNSLKLTLDSSTTLSVLLSVLGESLLLGLVPVLVESSLDLIRQVLGPDSGEGTETTGSLDVTNNTDDNERRSVNNSDGLDDLTLVHLGTTSVKITDGGSHTSLVTKEGSQTNGLGLVIGREGLNLSSVASSSLSGQESERTVSGGFVLTVGHFWLLFDDIPAQARKGKRREEKRE